MPFRKKYRFHKKRPVRKYRRRRTSGIRKSLAKLWDRVGAIEYKYTQDTSVGNANWTGTLISLCEPPQGVGDFDARIGDKIKMQRLTMRGHFAYSALNSVCRVIIFMDKEDSVGATGDLILDAGTIAVVDAPKVYDKRFKTKILYDKRFPVYADKPFHFLRCNIPLNKVTIFNNGSTAINNNMLKMLIVCDAASSVNNPAYTLTTRVTYTDN